MTENDHPPKVPRRAYTCEEFASHFGKTRFWAYKLANAGKIKVLRGYGSLLVPAEEVDRLVAEAAALQPDSNPAISR